MLILLYVEVTSPSSFPTSVEIVGPDGFKNHQKNLSTNGSRMCQVVSLAGSVSKFLWVVTSSSQFSSSGPRPIGEEDNDVDGTNDEVDDDCIGGKKQVDDLAIQRKLEPDKESINAPSLNLDMLLLKGVPHQTRVHQETEAATLIITGNKVQLSSLPRTTDQEFKKSPSQVESQASESTNKAQVNEAQEEIRGNDLVRQQEEVERTAMLTYGPVVIERPSQVPGIELEVDLNQRNIRKIVRSQMYEECMSSNGVNSDDETYISTSQEQLQKLVDKELQLSLSAGAILRIDYEDTTVMRMRKMIETDAKELQLRQRNNRWGRIVLRKHLLDTSPHDELIEVLHSTLAFTMETSSKTYNEANCSAAEATSTPFVEKEVRLN
ncbi:hypothetical protein RHSIM_Rhsim11G0006600 [Rhododendron simsii]|uniref:Uncharacterized protein n=1 Tax=Rhododendron simsii TaxID=118357 RepID=A0A834G653_RHOSS|nr:hypothetical protein RHSIM_Rhsim11G0006600 [Rhododendron simsii]